MIILEFERLGGPARFVDALVLTAAEFAALTPADIETMQQARFDAWLVAVTSTEEV